MYQITWLAVLTVAVLFGNGYCAAPTIDFPPQTGGYGSIAEDAAIGSSIITLQATDKDGDVTFFTVEEQTPDLPVFTINANDEIIVPSGLDADSGATAYYFRFGVTDGTSAAVTTYNLTITDVNDEAPVFSDSTYTGSVIEGAAAGTVITQVFAEDPDLTKQTLTYSIPGAQTIFQVDSSGVITVTGSSGLTPQTLTLIVEASDGLLTGIAQVEVLVLVDYCARGQYCQNGGTCSNNDAGTSYECACPDNWTGTNCTKATTREKDGSKVTTAVPASTGVIAGAVVGGLAVVVAVAIVSFLLGKRQRTTKPQTQQETRVQHETNTREVTLPGDQNTVHLYDDACVVIQDTLDGDVTYLTPSDNVMRTGDATKATASDDVKYDDATTTGLYMGLMPTEAHNDYSVLFQKP